MGDVRFLPEYQRVRDAKDRAEAIRALDDEAIIAALAATAMARDEYLANVLATEAQNRARASARALESVPEAILTLSHPLRRVDAANKAARALLSLPASEIGGTPAEMMLADEADGPALDAYLDAPRDALEVRLRHVHGGTFLAELRASPVEDDHERRTGTMLVVRSLDAETVHRLPVRDLARGGPRPFEVRPLVARTR